MRCDLPFRKDLCFLIVLLLVSLNGTSSFAQNLVPNGSFELYNYCPDAGGALLDGIRTPGGLPYCQNWHCVQTPSAEYFNSCATGPRNSVPVNTWGNQQARTGNAYASFEALGFYSQGYFREYPTVRLIAPLEKDSAYCVRFYVSLTGTPPSVPNLVPVGISDMGAYFSDVQPVRSPANSVNPLVVPYHIRNSPTQYLTDTVNWMEVKGTYLASGGEEYITIGCFEATLPSYRLVTGVGGLTPFSRYYLDDVSVTPARRKDTFRYVHACDTMLLQSSNPAGPYWWDKGNRPLKVLTQSTTVRSSDTYVCRSLTDNCEVLFEHFVVDLQNTSYDTTRSETSLCQKRATITSAKLKGPYSWSTGDTSRSIEVASSGDYSCTVRENCMIGTEVFRMMLDSQAVPSPVVRDTTICQHIAAPVLAVSDSGLLWFEHFSGGVGDSTQPVINTELPGKFTVYVAAKMGLCMSRRVPVNIEIRAAPKASPADTILRCKTPYRNPVQVGEPLAPDVTYTWNTGETSCCVYVYKDETYTRIATNSCGSVTDTFLLKSENCDHCVFFPDAFTPNNDGLNDRFKAMIRCPLQWVEFRVFNNWGEQVFATEDPDEAWDGTQKGKNAPGGVYMYFATYLMKQGQFTTRQVVKGEVTLIR